MKAPVRPTDDLDFAICGICGEEHDCGFGFAPSGNHKILWTCQQCLSLGPDAYGVVKMKGSLYAREARDRAGEAGGAYLEKIGKFSLADLTEDEWRQFLDILFKARADHLRHMYATNAAPF